MARHAALRGSVLATLHQSIENPRIKVLLRIVRIDRNRHMGDGIDQPSICRVDRERITLAVNGWLPVIDILIDGIVSAEEAETEAHIDSQTRCSLEIVLDVRF